MKASIWRALMAIGMKFHHLADPRPPRPNFKIVIPSRLSPRGGTFKLVFYVPQSYFEAPDEYRYPVVVNFHGGGFTLGTGTDDARWASTVIEQVDAVFVSVEYRLAPEYPFSVGVEDGTDALIYLASHAEELRLDPNRMALSGFSAGGNFAFTVPLMLYDLQNDAGKRTLLDSSKKPKKFKNGHHQQLNHNYLHPQSADPTPSSSQLSLPRPTQTRTHSSTTSIVKLSDLEPTALEIAHQLPALTLKCIISFYPPTDFRSSRDEKRLTNPAPEKNLPPMLTNLFDASYIHPSDAIDLTDPYLSPAAASDSLLRSAYPEDIILYTCEYDMLNAEGVAFGERLRSKEVGKVVHGGLVKEVPHAFDKKPNPVSFPKSAERCYSEACAELRRVFGGRSSVEERRQLELEEEVERFDGVGSLPGMKGEVKVDRTGERERDGSREGRKGRSPSNPGKAFKLENMI
ncbi:alpha/beta-hydrolase [Mollisia scopiformis]|uniref:Alpha/beta-hydrolase n=1 Tax=Mollisia scopiformis TaxID=149040 RepID=A0A132BCI5_MOLSC|nr:alpha/beta-hydrolase [Mollisia scopiformis]KUJ09963.1 alpha/beta-hydrolase [Mollisia scopiformis]